MGGGGGWGGIGCAGDPAVNYRGASSLAHGSLHLASSDSCPGAKGVEPAPLHQLGSTADDSNSDNTDNKDSENSNKSVKSDKSDKSDSKDGSDSPDEGELPGGATYAPVRPGVGCAATPRSPPQITFSG